MKKTTLSKIFGVAVVVALIASLIVAAVPSSAVTISAVKVGNPVISAKSTYQIEFTGTYNLAVTDQIVVTFPTDTTMPTSFAAGDVTFDDGAGTVADVDNADITAGTRIVTIHPHQPATIGNVWVLKFTNVTNGVTNPSAPGSYTLTVAVNKADGSTKEAAVTTSAYTISVPVSISNYNSAGNFLGTYTGTTALAQAFPAIPDKGSIKLGPGTYDEAGITLAANFVTVTSTGTNADTILKKAITVTGHDCVIDDLNIGGITVNGYNTTVQSCVFAKPPPVSTPMTMITFNDGAYSGVLKNSTIDTTPGVAGSDVGVFDNADKLTIDTVTFKVNQGAGLDDDIAISTGSAANNLTVKNSTFTGSSGIGYKDAFTTKATIDKNTFTSLSQAIVLSGSPIATISNNTIDKSTKAGPGIVGAIEINCVGGDVTISNNTISNGASASISVADAPNTYAVAGNRFLTNAKGFYTTVAFNVALNWWGSVAGPTTATVTGGDTIVNSTGTVTYKPFLTAATSSSAACSVAASAAGALAPSSVVQINGYTNSSTTAASIISANVFGTTNPVTVLPPFPVVAYYDVYTSTPSSTAVQLQFSATGISTATQVYWYSGAVSNWVLCSSQGVAGTGAYAYVNLSLTTATNPTSPNVGDLGGTAFALVTGLPPAPAAFDVNSPALGSTTGLTNVPFSWNAVSNATSYEFILSKNADMSSPVVDQINLSGTAFTYTGTLTAGPYYWVAKAYQNNAVIAKSVTGTFIAAAPAAPVPTTTQQVVITSVPAPVITITQQAPTTITIAQPAVNEITPTWIWGIIGIGAVLIIVVIVLIVRTRRSV